MDGFLNAIEENGFAIWALGLFIPFTLCAIGELIDMTRTAISRARKKV